MKYVSPEKKLKKSVPRFFYVVGIVYISTIIKRNYYDNLFDPLNLKVHVHDVASNLGFLATNQKNFEKTSLNIFPFQELCLY